MGKGARFRHLEACFHYPEVAESSMDPSQVHSAHRFASIRFVDLAPKSAVSKTPFLPLAFHLSFSPSVTIWAGSFPDPRGYSKVMLYIGSSIHFQLVKGLHLLCAGKDTPCLIECLT
jgi:hypothetical protein